MGTRQCYGNDIQIMTAAKQTLLLFLNLSIAAEVVSETSCTLNKQLIFVEKINDRVVGEKGRLGA